MGVKCRLNRAWLMVGVLSLAAFGCKDEDAEQRRQLLSARERTQERTKRVDAQRVRSPSGELLPSTVVRAGIVLPRGFKPKFEEEHSWTYDAQLPQPKVEAYFDQRLATQDVKREAGEVEYLAAREKSDPNAAVLPVVVAVSPTPGKGEGWTRIVVRERPPPRDVAITTLDIVRDQAGERRQKAR